ncbi:MAG: DedA family protein, partial [Ignavibacteria bacterium]|nr:DedA family protein [Ignavibacteria bacterium]
MVEEIISFLRQIDPFLIYLAVFGIAFIENIFPPFPSDVIVAFSGALAAVTNISLPLVIIFAVTGSTTGFVTMYFIGKFFGDKILEKGKLKFISPEAVFTVERWFQKYGYWLIIANRFLAGTRAIISFFAGMSELNLKRTVILSAVSAFIWNLILIFVGFYVGHNLSK